MCVHSGQEETWCADRTYTTGIEDQVSDLASSLACTSVQLPSSAILDSRQKPSCPQGHIYSHFRPPQLFLPLSRSLDAGFERLSQMPIACPFHYFNRPLIRASILPPTSPIPTQPKYPNTILASSKKMPPQTTNSRRSAQTIQSALTSTHRLLHTSRPQNPELRLDSIDRSACGKERQLTQPNRTNRRLLRLLLALHIACGFAAFVGFCARESFVCASLLGGLGLCGRLE